MLGLIERPLTRRESVLAGALLVASGALYCLAYTWSRGVAEHPLQALGWTGANLLPWLAALELAKRTGSGNRLARAWTLVAILAGAAMASLAIEIALGLIPIPRTGEGLLFEAVRRVPGAALVLLLLGLARVRRLRPVAEAASDAATLPLLPGQIEWVRAAGNYVEFHAGGRLVMRRMTIKQAEAALAAHGFLRIHRSLLVNQVRIARFHQGKLADEIALVDGTTLKVGGAYRSQLRRWLPRRAA